MDAAHNVVNYKVLIKCGCRAESINVVAGFFATGPAQLIRELTDLTWTAKIPTTTFTCSARHPHLINTLINIQKS